MADLHLQLIWVEPTSWQWILSHSSQCLLISWQVRDFLNWGVNTSSPPFYSKGFCSVHLGQPHHIRIEILMALETRVKTADHACVAEPVITSNTQKIGDVELWLSFFFLFLVRSIKSHKHLILFYNSQSLLNWAHMHEPHFHSHR